MKHLMNANIADLVLLIIGHGVDAEFYLWRQNLVPAVDGTDEEAGVEAGAGGGEAAGAAEGVLEAGVREEVFFYCLALDRGGGLSEAVDDGLDVADWQMCQLLIDALSPRSGS